VPTNVGGIRSATGILPPFNFKPGVCLSGLRRIAFAQQVGFLVVDSEESLFFAFVDGLLWGYCFCHECTSLVKNVPLGTFSAGTMSKIKNLSKPQALVFLG
jgi:hypothetical protein